MLLAKPYFVCFVNVKAAGVTAIAEGLQMEDRDLDEAAFALLRRCRRMMGIIRLLCREKCCRPQRGAACCCAAVAAARGILTHMRARIEEGTFLARGNLTFALPPVQRSQQCLLWGQISPWHPYGRMTKTRIGVIWQISDTFRKSSMVKSAKFVGVRSD